MYVSHDPAQIVNLTTNVFGHEQDLGVDEDTEIKKEIATTPVVTEVGGQEDEVESSENQFEEHVDVEILQPLL